jgi:hypothetical protein
MRTTRALAPDDPSAFITALDDPRTFGEQLPHFRAALSSLARFRADARALAEYIDGQGAGYPCLCEHLRALVVYLDIARTSIESLAPPDWRRRPSGTS